MQTFLPLPDFVASVKTLDDRRCVNQVYEAKAILLHLTAGWHKRYTHHPVMGMWKGYAGALAWYMQAAYAESIRRGLSVGYELSFSLPEQCVLPGWFGNEKFHSVHRANLIRKSPEWYLQFGWTESGELGYLWPKFEDGEWLFVDKRQKISVPAPILARYGLVPTTHPHQEIKQLQ